MKTNNLKPLSIVFAIGGLWDTVAGVLYVFVIGTGRLIQHPPADPFYAVFLGSFFFCFAWLQLLSSRYIRHYALNVGCLVFGRLFYVIVLYYFMFFVDDFPSTFWFTGIIDALLVVLTLYFAWRGGLGLRDIFLPAST